MKVVDKLLLLITDEKNNIGILVAKKNKHQ